MERSTRASSTGDVIAREAPERCRGGGTSFGSRFARNRGAESGAVILVLLVGAAVPADVVAGDADAVRLDGAAAGGVLSFAPPPPPQAASVIAAVAVRASISGLACMLALPSGVGIPTDVPVPSVSSA